MFAFSNAEAEPAFHAWNSFKGARENLEYHITGIIEDCTGNYWIATNTDGLLKIDWKEDAIQQFFPDPKDPDAIAGHQVTALEIDQDCNLWLALGGQGLSLLLVDQQNTPNPVFRQWSVENSNLPDNGVNDVFQDEQGRIWISSASGVSRFDRTTNTFHTYGPESGMKTIPQGMIPSRDGGIYIRGLNGIGYFYPDKLAENQHIPPVYLKDIQIDGHSLPVAGSPADTLDFPSPLQHSITFTEEIRLKYDQNDIRLEFVALNYTAPEQNQFEYQLIGEDEDWQSTGAVNPYATYTNLDPGEYTFRVRGANNDGHWNLEGATLAIIFTPPWWATPWAYLLYALIGFSIIALIYRFQLNRRLAEAEARRLQELDSVKTKLYTNITHEFRTPLTVIEGMADQIRNDPKQWFSEGLELIKHNSRRLLQLVNQMLALRKLESGNLPVQMVQEDVVNYLQYIAESFHSYAESKDIRPHFLCDHETIEMDYDPENLQTIVANLLSNAIKFTPSGGDVYLQAGRGKAENGIIQSEGALTNSAFRFPTSDFRFPTSAFRFPLSDFRFPTSDFRLPLSDFRLPLSDFRLFTTNG